MSAIRHPRARRALPALTVLLALAWLVSAAAPAPGNGLAAPSASANAKAAMVRQHQVLGGLVAHRRDKPGRSGLILLGVQTGALATLLLVAAGSRSPAAAHPRRRIRHALVDARAPPRSGSPDLAVCPPGAMPGARLGHAGNEGDARLFDRRFLVANLTSQLTWRQPVTLPTMDP
jgi:hypothetical protein